MNLRLQIAIRGAVQGVGFRPFIYRLAANMNLTGFVYNSSLGVFIGAEGIKSKLDEFILRIEKEKPPLAEITGMEFSFLDCKGYTEFKILKSKDESKISALILPDIAVCEDCLIEMFDENDRRYLYPFTNCTNCGPRFSIIENLPYDRPNTSMKIFNMCDACRAEYEDPLNRRFHAQPIACPKCGPHVELWDEKGEILSRYQGAIDLSLDKIRAGKIIALKGLGGYQLIADARNEDAVARMRKRKHREEKPFAVMFPSLESVKEICLVSVFEERLLKSPESPIVLLKKDKSERTRDSKYLVCSSTAPNNPYLGIMIPYTPLHHIIMRELDFPIIATSGNISEEPMCINESEVMDKLKNIAEFFLVHNRPIVRHVDDSIVRVALGRELVLRRARGYAPYPIKINSEVIKDESGTNIFALGGHLKNSVALKIEDNVFVSQHIGDLSSESSYKAFVNVIEDFKKLYRVNPDQFICDNHPDYLSTKYAKVLTSGHKSVQHHYAHIAACRAENQLEGGTLGVSWDGTGYGLDGTIWGSEFFISDDYSYSHAAQFRQFRLPGGDKGVKEGRRGAAGIFYEIFGDGLFDEHPALLHNFSKPEISLIKGMLQKKINSPLTSSAGRVFDAVASILDISHVSNFEGQSAMMLEFAADVDENDFYPFEIKRDKIIIIDWEPMINYILKDLKLNVPVSSIAGKFHNTLSRIILAIADIINENKVVLSGGCFQNVILIEKTTKLLESKGYKVYSHQRIPPNDGGISLGQIAAYNVKALI